MTNLDSRSLTYVNTFGRRFTRPGQVRYRVGSAAAICRPSDEEFPFTIDVAKGQGGKQHNIAVELRGDRFETDPPELTIAEGDVVLWHSPSPAAGYVIQGDGEAGSFDSSSLTNDVLYTHAFGTPGEYEWVDAIGRSVSGLVTVTTLDTSDRKQCGEWVDALERGTLVVIDGNNSDPAEVSIVAGQTVLFAIVAADGITVTDARFLPGERAPSEK